MNFKERIINGLYGQAVLDAVGNPFEFKKNINPNDVVAYANLAKQLVISDDTQMTMFGFEAIHNLDKFDGDISDKIRSSFTNSYLDWLETQSSGPPLHQLYDNGLLSFESVWSVQAPGNTCLSALYTISQGREVVNDSMGCGSCMRLLPLVSLFDKYSLDDVVKFAQITGNITHKHKDNDSAIRRYMEVAYNIVNDIPVVNIHPEVIHASQLGEGWIATECVEIAIWAYCTATSFDDLLCLCCSIDGDSDSVAAVSGSLYGLSGKEIPQKYVAKLDALDAIEYIIGNL